MAGRTTQLDGQRVLVIGLGMTGRSAAAYCADEGARVVAVDARAELETEVALDPRVEVQLGGPLPEPADFDLVVPSPGVPWAEYGPRARAVAGDIELAADALSVPIVAVTGTNGKSTTVSLLEAMLRAAGWRARAAGNLGVPALDLVGDPLDVAILEVSSFQLEAVQHFRPTVALWLNLSADHLDRHGDMEGYRQAKLRCFMNQEESDTAVLNADDPWVAKSAAEMRAAKRWFGRTAEPPSAGFDADALFLNDGQQLRRLPLDGVTPGGAIRANLPAALLACDALGADLGAALAALDRFEALPHRGQCVAVRGGVRFVDDSKATNPGAALAAVAQVRGPVHWILGGRDKGLRFDELTRAPFDRVRAVLLIGEASETLAPLLEPHARVVRCETLERAIEAALADARDGDTVLLAPACASFDQFDGYAARGEHFARLAREAAA